MKRFLLLAGLCILFSVKGFSKGIPIPFSSGSEYITIVDELPDVEQFSTDEGFVDIGYKYKQFWILWIPIWNYDGQYCLTTAEKDVYYEIPMDVLEEHAKEHEIKLPSNPIPFWDKIGGKVLWLIIIVGGLYFYMKKD